MFDVVPINYQVWLICGGRNFSDKEMFNSAMHDLMSLRGMPSVVVQGGAKGADTLAKEWAGHHALKLETEKAKWNVYGKSAGAIRNQEMLDKYNPDFVVAFPGGRGTADMVRRSKKIGLDVAEIKVGALHE